MKTNATENRITVEALQDDFHVVNKHEGWRFVEKESERGLLNWVEVDIYCISRNSGPNGRDFSIMHNQGGTGAYPIQNVRNLKVNGKPVNLPILGDTVSQDHPEGYLEYFRVHAPKEYARRMGHAKLVGAL